MKNYEINISFMITASQYDDYEKILADFEESLHGYDIEPTVEEQEVETDERRRFKVSYISEDYRLRTATYVLEDNNLRGDEGFSNKEVIAPDMTKDEQEDYNYITKKIIADIRSINGMVNVIYELSNNKMVVIYS